MLLIKWFRVSIYLLAILTFIAIPLSLIAETLSSSETLAGSGDSIIVIFSGTEGTGGSSIWTEGDESIYRESGNVGIGTSTPQSSAILDLTSILRGFLLPRMTSSQRDAIVDPTNGLQIFNTTNGCINYYLNGSWYELCGNCTPPPPSAPIAGTHIPAQTQIIWNWNTASGATGYKWNTADDYGSAQDMSVSTTKTETGLTCSNSYNRYTWAYNGCGHSTATTLTQSTSTCPNACNDLTTMTDSRDSKVYNIVAIGSQCWMAQNLNYGTKINGTSEQTNNSITEKYCQSDNESNCTTYGGLYQWAEMAQYINGATNTTSWNPVPSDNLQGICPSGWHLPTDVEWCTMENTVEPGTDPSCNSTDWRGTYTGAKLKEAGTSHWTSPNNCGTGCNTSGFTALPGGTRWTDGVFHDLNNWYVGWTVSQNSATQGWRRHLFYDYTTILRGVDLKTFGFVVRCVKNSCTTPSDPTASGTTICTGNTATLNATAPGGEYKWYDAGAGGTLLYTGVSYTTPTLTSTTTYYVQTTVSGCTSSRTAVTVIVTPLPSSPTANTHTPATTQIVWNWNTVSGATGYKWGTTNVYGSATDMGTNTSKTETGLTCGTPYTRYVWAYGTCGNSSATTLTQSTSACPFTCGSSFVDSRDSKTYNTVLIGSQCWLAQNLNYGTKINETSEQTNNSIAEKYCQNDLESNCTTYGGLYQWAEMVQYYNGATNTTSWSPAPSGNVQGICPSGWHLPTDAEWCTMENTVEAGTDPSCNSTGWRGTNTGAKLKEAGTSHWNSPNNCGTGCNTSGFTALPGGTRFPDGTAHDLNVWFVVWTGSQSDASNGWRRHLYNQYTTILRGADLKTFGFAVRCVKD